MKMIMALIEPHKLRDVKKALYDAQIFHMTVSNALGCSEDPGFKETYRGVDVDMFLVRKIRIEIAVNEDFVEPAIKAICESAWMDVDRNHGMIFVYELTDAIKVTGERGGHVL